MIDPAAPNASWGKDQVQNELEQASHPLAQDAWLRHGRQN
jgi:hypothetical protein